MGQTAARRRLGRWMAACGLATAAVAAPASRWMGAEAVRPASIAALPARLSDAEFWRLIGDASEPGGYFRAANITNLTSNELWFQYVIPELTTRVKPGLVYLGVGPEQNFTYIAATRPSMAIVFDIRRGNLDLQLMYKAIFELSADRADFVSMLFGKPRPAGLTASSTAEEIFRAFAAVPSSQARYEADARAIVEHLTRTHALPLPAEDVAGVREVYETFYLSGFAVRASPTYADLMTATDAAGVSRSFLASEANYRVLKDLETRNLLVPVVGDFGGPKAIRAVGTYLKGAGAQVGAFYLSNVEQYLAQDGKSAAFCRNVASLPLADASTFIRSSSNRGFGRGFGGGFESSLGDMRAETRACAAGRKTEPWATPASKASSAVRRAAKPRAATARRVATGGR